VTASGVNVEAVYPLTPVQEGILFHTLYAPESPLYLQQYVARLDGDLDVAAFRRSWQLVIDRHEVLRSLVTWEGRERPLQVVRRRVEPEWRIEDWRTDTSAAQTARFNRFLENDRRRRFALDVAPLMRFALLRIAGDTHRFVWSHHHVVIDGWSMAIVLSEVFRSYEAIVAGVEPQLPPPAPYREYVRWLHTSGTGGAEEHWRRSLAGFTTATKLRIEAPGVTSPWAERHGEEVVRLGVAATERLAVFARSSGVTLNTVLRDAWSLLLNRYSGDEDVVFGATVAGRPAELDRAMEMVGLFINTLPVRVRIERDTAVVDWLRQLQQQQIAATPYEATPLVEVQGWSEVPAGDPMFQTLLVFENVPHPETKAGGLTTTDIRYLQRSNYPLAVLVMPGAELELVLLYDADRYHPAVIGRLARQLIRVLETIGDDPWRPVADVELFPRDELTEMVAVWNNTEAAYPAGETIHSLVLASAARTPQHLAVVGDGASLTYADLVAKATDVARRLGTLGVGPGVRVGVAMERSPATVTAILGVLLAGGAYVPLDPRQPPARLGYLIADTSAAAIVTQGEPVALGDIAPTVAVVRTDETGPPVAGVATAAAGPDDLAYVLFTSGSTGRPKGVAVTHRSLVNSTHARLHAYGDPVGTFLLLSPFVFDSSLAGLFATLTQGGTLVLPAPDMEKDVRHLAELIATHQVTHTLLLPTLYAMLLEHADPAALRSLRLVMVAGEACPPSLMRRHHSLLPDTRLVNEYGPTEATVWCTVHHTSAPEPADDESDHAPRVPIGRPIANMQTFILDPWLRPVPVGVPGELHVAGVGLARGYLDQPALTAERFIETDLPVAGRVRLYRTGDVARHLPDGSIDLLGRVDHQVKIRGQRIELAEIEMVLREHQKVRDAVVVASTTGSGATAGAVLVAYVEPDVDGESVRRFLAERLPAVMVPARVVTLGALPRGVNGKVDRTALPDPGHPAPRGGEGFVAPATDVERRLAEIWSGVLGVESVGVTDNFFDLGGDSILSIRIIARAHETGLAITPRQLFEHPTIAELAAIVEAAGG